MFQVRELLEKVITEKMHLKFRSYIIDAVVGPTGFTN